MLNIHFSSAYSLQTSGQRFSNTVLFGKSPKNQTAEHYESMTQEDNNGSTTHPRYLEICNEPWLEKFDASGGLKKVLSQKLFFDEGWGDIDTKWDLPGNKEEVPENMGVIISLNDQDKREEANRLSNQIRALYDDSLQNDSDNSDEITVLENAVKELYKDMEEHAKDVSKEVFEKTELQVTSMGSILSCTLPINIETAKALSNIESILSITR